MPPAQLTTAPAALDVFINIPFDAKGAKVYLGLIAGLTSLGLVPRSVIELPPSQSRLARLVALIRGCQYSIHDLSRVQTSKIGDARIPRFNMPFELGLAVAIAEQSSHAHQWRVLECVPYRLSQSLSDLGGFDPIIYNDRLDDLFDGLLDAFAHRSARPIDNAKEMRQIYNRLRQFRDTLPDNIYRPDPFGKLGLAASKIVKAHTG